MSDHNEFEFPEPCFINFPKQRLKFVSGHPDSLLFGYFFQLTTVGGVPTNAHPLQPRSAATVRRPNASQSPISTHSSVAGQQAPDEAVPDDIMIKPDLPPGEDVVHPKDPYDSMRGPGLFGDQVGILFYERVRFRNVGRVLGEHITTLSLAPGEEANFTQRQETVRRTSLEDVHTHEQELEKRLSSTLSTEWSSDNAKSVAQDIGATMGVNLQMPVEFLTIGGGNQATINLSESNSHATQLSFTRDLVQEMSRRLREEHRVTIQTSHETSTLFESSRRVINNNPMRTLDLAFYKIYNKERVSLERYDAKLALNLTVNFPLTALVNQIHNDLDEIDPAKAANYCQSPEESETVPEEFWITWDDPTDPLNIQPFVRKDLRATPPKPGWVYWSHAEPEVLEVKRKFAGADTLSDWSVSDFEQATRITARLDPPGMIGEDISRIIHIGIAETRSLFGTTWLPGSWWVKKVKLRVPITFAPPHTLKQAGNCLDSERERLQNEITSQRIDAIFHNRMHMAREHVFSRVLQEYIIRTISGSEADRKTYERFFMLGHNTLFEWNEAVIQYVPFWMGSEAQQAYEELRKRIRVMLPGYDLSRVLDHTLFASVAQVILPIRYGSEQRMLEMLKHNHYNLSDFVKQFHDYRDQHYGDIGRSLPSHDEILSSKCEFATPTDEEDWQNDWEHPARRFDVLGQWAEYKPTDGVHVESTVGSCSGADEGRTKELILEAEERRLGINAIRTSTNTDLSIEQSREPE